MSRLSDSTSRHARHDKRDSRDTLVDWGGYVHLTFFPEIVTEIDANPEHRKPNLDTRALLLLRRQAMYKQARRVTHDKRDTLVTSCVSCRDVVT